mgnify:CR=1 FL=1
MVEAIDVRPLVSSKLNLETTSMLIQLNAYQEDISLNLIACPHRPIILILPWLESHKPIIYQWSQSIKFSLTCFWSPTSSSHLQVVSLAYIGPLCATSMSTSAPCTTSTLAVDLILSQATTFALVVDSVFDPMVQPMRVFALKVIQFISKIFKYMWSSSQNRLP